MAHPRPAYDAVSVGTLEFWALTPEQREQRLGVLRRERPVSWQPPAEGSMLPQEDGAGFWAITRHEDIQAVSKNPVDFCSGQGVMIEDVPDDILEAASSFLATDAPRHTKLRKLVSAAFTPKQVKRIEDQIQDQARRIVDDLIEVGDCDFVEQVSRRLPMWTIYEMCGLAPERRDAAAHAADGMVSWGDEDVRAGKEPAELLNNSLITLINIGIDLAEDRRANPRSDLMTNLVQAEVDGEKLTDEDIAAFFVLLSVAGNDTTRNTISRTMQALTRFPDQRKILQQDYDATIGTAIEEFVRWASPVMTFRRTATRDTEFRGQQIRKGDWLVMYYASGNRDADVFEDPLTFDVRRDPNPHVAFGGGGPHFCMGNMLAKTQMRALFGQLLERVPNLQTGEPVQLVGNFVDGVKSMPCTLEL
ncbi:cytochrome P450 (plasmid) [Pseudonocardia sp. EC080610-09]|uniref:cytochrome P450 n=1 Tax=unclassified Pseudonocardia TaxID=2619320 RepID=UPI000706D6AA|nr:MULTISPECIES: cytochrome P450 [unclassified Pseudonocardia]ALL79742.1 cytochrome P450 [Pseudonocardia sp. EC080610-09]ALL85175.1 cytochrome P450 [Pseudonocardia sp. EC080619-01]